jgi:hypothetical protein
MGHEMNVQCTEPLGWHHATLECGAPNTKTQEWELIHACTVYRIWGTRITDGNIPRPNPEHKAIMERVKERISGTDILNRVLRSICHSTCLVYLSL